MTLNRAIFIAALLGVVAGLGLKQLGIDHALSNSALYACSLLAGIFIGLLKMVMVPLIFCSVVCGIAGLATGGAIRRLVLITIAFFATTCLIAMALGLVSMHLFTPGAGLTQQLFADADNRITSLSFAQFAQHFVGVMFANPIKSMAEGTILAVLVFAIFVGAALYKLAEQASALQQLFQQFLAVMMQIMQWVMYLAPLGIFALLTELIAKQDMALFASVGKFMAVVTGATIVHGLIILPPLLWLLTRYSPIAFLKGARPALITAFATSSSAATLPVTLKALADMNVKPQAANFVAPLGAQINMDGTALYEAGAALFIAQLMGIELSLSQQILVCLVTMIASLGAPGIPSAGMVTMVMVLEAVGLPAEAIAILLPIDRVLDTVRTAVNVEGDLACSVLVSHFSPELGNELRS